MPPRFLERMERQSATYKAVFGEPQYDPPPYPFSRGRSESMLSTASAQSQRCDAHGKPLPPPPQYHQVHQPMAIDLDKPALPADSLVLVTGANGWHGMHIVDQLLEHGYRVRGTVRDAEKAVATSTYFGEKYPAKFTTAVVPDMVPQGAFDLAARGCSGIVHAASVMTYSPDPNEVVTPTIAGALNALEAAAKEPGVKRFVYCSAAAAAVAPGLGVRDEVTHESWNMSAFSKAWAPPPYTKGDRGFAVFASSKMQTEQAVWRWYRKQRPQFVLNTVLPSVCWGKVLDMKSQGYRTSVAQLKSIYDGQAAATTWTPPQCFVDVQDSALLHVAALTLPDVRGQRIFAAESPFNIVTVLRLLRALFPDREFGDDVSDESVDMTVFREISYAKQLLKRMGKDEWTDMETSVRRNCEAF